MQIRVEQGCPQCGAPVELYNTQLLFGCNYCGVRSYITGRAPFRYTLPEHESDVKDLVYAPFLHFKGTIYLVSEKGITHKVVDTSQAGCSMPGLPPSLGVRPQAMGLNRLTAQTSGRFLKWKYNPGEILSKAVHVSGLTARGHTLYHRAYLGEAVSLIYLPLRLDEAEILDGVTGHPLLNREDLGDFSLQGIPFQPSWQVKFHAALCPHCGWNLDGEATCRVVVCKNCLSAWEIANEGLKKVPLYLGFWKIATQVPELQIRSYADFIRQTNQPVLQRQQWHDQGMQFIIPAFKIRPKIFLQAGKQATICQWRMQLREPMPLERMGAVTLPSAEARQAIKLLLAAAATSPRRIYPFLPRIRLEEVSVSLLFLPFEDRGHDWVQPETGVVIGKNILRFGKSL